MLICLEKGTNLIKVKYLFGLITALLFISGSAVAQSVQVAGFFPTIDLSLPLASSVDASLYYFGAFPVFKLNTTAKEKIPDLFLLYAEQALTYHFNPHLSLTASYVYQKTIEMEGKDVNENRLYFQATYKHSIKSLQLKHRLRFDNRFVQNRETGNAPYTHRLRYLAGFEFPINNKIYASAYEELFLNTTPNANVFYEENWAYAALGYKINPSQKIEAGPLYITWYTGGSSWLNQYYLQLTWIARINAGMKKK